MKYLLCFAFLIFVLGLSNAQNKQEIIKISPDDFTDQKVMLSDIADDIQYIPLGRGELIAGIASVKINDKLIFIGGNRDSGVLEYNIDGSFNRKIGSIGNGPGQYRDGSYITLDNKSQRIYILDSEKVLVYNFKGTFIRKIGNSEFNNFSKIHFIDNKLYLFGVVHNSTILSYPHYWMITDSLGKVQYTKMNTMKGFSASNMIAMYQSNKAYEYDNKLHYWNHYSDTIFELKGTSYKAKYLIEKGRNRMTPENSADPDKFNNSNFYIFKDIQESKHYLFIGYSQFGKSNMCVYDKNTKVYRKMTFERGEPIGFPNDLDAGLPFYISEITNYKNEEYLIGWRFPYELKAHVASEAFKNSTPKFPEKKKALEKLANSLNEIDNPVLMLVKLKE